MRVSTRFWSVALLAVSCGYGFAISPASALYVPPPPPAPSSSPQSNTATTAGESSIQEAKTCIDQLASGERAASLFQIGGAYHAVISSASGCAGGFNEARFSVPGQYNAIMGNSSLRLQLSANGIAVKDVVGIEVKNGRLVVHVATQ